MSTPSKEEAATIPPPTSQEDNNDTANKREASTNNSKNKRKRGWHNKQQQKRRERAEKQPQHTGHRRGPDTDEWQSQQPHLGSFAHASMQEKFQVQLPQPSSSSSSITKVSKKKVAMLLAYTGTNYGGFQINNNQRTIHAELELALYRAQFLTCQNFGFPHKYGWSTSARTDKGVHACAQVVSCKLSIPHDDLEVARQEINQYLPNDVRVLDIVKTSKGFCARTQRDRVRYTYMVPSFLFVERDELGDLFQRVLGNDVKHGRSARDPLTADELTTLKTTLHKFRATPQDLKNLQDALSQYEGTLSYHNFTSRKSAIDADAQRYIISFTTQEPIVLEGGIEWIPTQVVGQSFLLHQIRKMVALAVDVARGAASLEVMKHALSPNTINLNMAPAQGLFLDMSYFEGFNRRKANEHLDDLDWVSNDTSPAVQRYQDFRSNVVMKHIGEEEAKEGNFVKYLYIQEHFYDCKNQYKLENTTKEEE